MTRSMRSRRSTAGLSLIHISLIPGAIVFLVLVLFCKLRNGKYKYDAHESGTVNIKKHSDAVSYTHLDVYKRQDTYRSSGAGGQHINKTSSAIRITHIPTGIVVQCQNERSQFQNKDKAMQMLKAKLYLLKQQENMEKLSGIRGEVTEIGWGNQIRSYVLQPYTMVKDHRTGTESGNVDSVLDGNLDPFINGYLKWIALGGKQPENADEEM